VDHPFCKKFDVDGDGDIDPVDIIKIIDELNKNGSGPAPPGMDVNGDGYVTPLDALLLINELNNPKCSHAKAPKSGPSGPTTSSGTTGPVES